MHDAATQSIDVEAELDALYRGPAPDFVAGRNRLAQRLKAAGDRAAAERVSKLSRPTPVAWMVNQLQFNDAVRLEALRAAGMALRQVQEAGAGGAEFAECTRAHQEALRAAVQRALDLGDAGGVRPTADLRRRVEMTLNLVGSAKDPVSPAPGRMSVELEPLGFDALGEVAPVAQKKPERVVRTPDEAARQERLATVKAALDAAEKEVLRLEREAELRAASRDRAARDLEDAESRREATRRAFDDARRTADEASARVASARETVLRARKALEEP